MSVNLKPKNLKASSPVLPGGTSVVGTVSLVVCQEIVRGDAADALQSLFDGCVVMMI
jgi:hypothetical protein